MKRIYLAGNISSDPATYEWRELVTKLMIDRYIVLNPAGNPFNKNLLRDHKKKDTDGFVKDAISKSQKILIIKDFNLVQSADIVIVNLCLLTEDKPMIGTVFELAWSWLLKKPVIAIVPKTLEGLSQLKRLYVTHPFITNSISAFTYSPEESVAFIDEFFVE